MLTSPIVIDASVLLATFIDEPWSADARRWLRSLAEGGRTPKAPTLVHYEVGNRIGREVSDRRKARAALRRLLRRVQTQPVPASEPLRLMPRLTYHDAAYVALASGADAALATFDDRMAATARSRKRPVWDWSSMRAALDPRFSTFLASTAPELKTTLQSCRRITPAGVDSSTALGLLAATEMRLVRPSVLAEIDKAFGAFLAHVAQAA